MKPLATLSVSPRRALQVLGSIALGLIVVHLVAMQIFFNPVFEDATPDLEYWHVSIFDLDEEESFGTWFSSGILALSSFLLFLQARILRARGDRWHRWWSVLGAGFIVLSIDEIVGMHEFGNTLLGDTSWTVVGGPLMLVVAAAYVPFFRRYWGRTAKLFLVSGVVYGLGAVGIEHISGTDVNSLAYNMSTAVEEGLEMGGVILFIYAVLDHMAGSSESPRLEVEVRGPEGAV